MHTPGNTVMITSDADGFLYAAILCITPACCSQEMLNLSTLQKVKACFPPTGSSMPDSQPPNLQGRTYSRLVPILIAI
jgi:hypothetical protein